MNAGERNPYVGLRPFDVDEGLLFFGRQTQITEVLHGLRVHRFVGVVGGSGSGKSSLLRAGIIPTLKAGYLVLDSDHWLVAIMKPGQSPLYNLASAIAQETIGAALPDVDALVQRMKESGAQALLDFVGPMRRARKSNFFLLVDQFEELFRFASVQDAATDHENEAIDFVNIILELSEQTELPFHVVITMRSDFIGDCARFFGLPEALNRSQFLVPRMSRVQLKQAIEGPAMLLGKKIEPALLSRLLNEVGRFRDELPVLQHALMRMWDHEDATDRNGELDLRDLESIGGLGKALSMHADEALRGLTSEQVQLTEVVFKALTAIDEHGRKIRRPALLSELRALSGAEGRDPLPVIKEFISSGRAFLVVSRTADGRDQVVDISHESLIRQWDRLGRWVDEEGASAETYYSLVDAAGKHAHARKGLLDDDELKTSLEWQAQTRPTLAWAHRYGDGLEEALVYLERSREGALKRKQLERSRRKRQRILVLAIMGLLFVGAVGAYLGLAAVSNKNAQLDKSVHTLEGALKAAATSAEQAKRSEDLAKRSFRKADSAATELRLQKDSVTILLQRSEVLYKAGLESEARALANEATAILARVRAERADSASQESARKATEQQELAERERDLNLSNVIASWSIQERSDPVQRAALALQALYMTETLGGDIRAPMHVNALRGALADNEKAWRKSVAVAANAPTVAMGAVGAYTVDQLGDNGVLYRLSFEDSLSAEHPKRLSPPVSVVGTDELFYSGVSHSVMLARADGSLVLWSDSTGSLLAEAGGGEHSDAVSCMAAYGTAGPYLTGDRKGRLVLWERQDRTLVAKARIDIGGVVKAMAPLGNDRMAVANRSDTVYLISAAGVLARMPVGAEVTAITASTGRPQGTLYMGTSTGKLLKGWPGSRLLELDDVSRAVEVIAIDADGTSLAYVDARGHFGVVLNVDKRKEHDETWVPEQLGDPQRLAGIPRQIIFDKSGVLYLGFGTRVERHYSSLRAMRERLCELSGRNWSKEEPLWISKYDVLVSDPCHQ